jgi:ornithine decarboxylase
VNIAIERPNVELESFASAEDLVSARRATRPVFCIYPRLTRDMARRFLDGFPGDVLFAVKANPEPRVLQELHGAGVRHFDTASLEEIALVRSLLPDATCYFMAPSKLVGAAEAAYRDYGLRHFVADHESEVARLLSATGPDARIHVRMKAHSEESIYELSSKFGAENGEVVKLLHQVAAAGRRPGLAFNVGSMCLHPDAYRRAIGAAARWRPRPVSKSPRWTWAADFRRPIRAWRCRRPRTSSRPSRRRPRRLRSRRTAGCSASRAGRWSPRASPWSSR